ncbi:MAG: MurR/RpiR family transcriptional regulator [Melioribacteraceae bacterium]|jgi:DNA-binding MurR/RpiR family transcriptional regulator|nr:hypothetical protein [Ignavibacteriota bacterium]MBZ0183068.1 MurR/RpiR family transcriptional regulator [Melioribacteraceae bacterium]
MGNLQIYKLVQEVYNKLPENQKQVADYIMHNTEKVMFMNVQELAKKTNVSVASVVRFSQRVGFKGFTELRTKLTDDFQNQIASKSIFPLIDNLKEDTLTSVANIEIKNINETINLVDRKGFNKAADIINKSKLVFCAGLGVSNILATLMSYQLSLIGVQSSSFIKGPLTFLEQAINIKKESALILFSFLPHHNETIELAEYANSNSIKVISFTNSYASPITKFSEVVIPVKTENMLFTNSVSSITMLINALATEVAIRNKSRAEKTLKRLNEIFGIMAKNNL